ncbi:unnamed protein product [Merluccius merluccius]
MKINYWLIIGYGVGPRREREEQRNRRPDAGLNKRLNASCSPGGAVVRIGAERRRRSSSRDVSKSRRNLRDVSRCMLGFAASGEALELLLRPGSATQEEEEEEEEEKSP